MKQTSRNLILAVGIVFAASSAFSAEKKRMENKPVGTDSAAVNAIKPFDKDHNYEIDLKEFIDVQAAFKAKPTGSLKQFDKGGDGKLDETVDRASMNIKLAAAKMDASKDSSEQPKKRKKK